MENASAPNGPPAGNRSATGPAGLAAGVAGGALALGFGELIEGVSETIPSLVVAVAEVVVDYTPGDVVAFSISNVGSAQKTLLVVGVVVVSLALSGFVGYLAARRGRLAALGGYALFGLVGGWAAARNPQSPALASWLVALAAAVLAAATTLFLVGRAAALRRPSSDADGAGTGPEGASGPSPERAGTRRSFFAFAAGAGVLALSLVGLGRSLRGESAAEKARETYSLPSRDPAPTPTRAALPMRRQGPNRPRKPPPQRPQSRPRQPSRPPSSSKQPLPSTSKPSTANRRPPRLVRPKQPAPTTTDQATGTGESTPTTTQQPGTGESTPTTTQQPGTGESTPTTTQQPGTGESTPTTQPQQTQQPEPEHPPHHHPTTRPNHHPPPPSANQTQQPEPEQPTTTTQQPEPEQPAPTTTQPPSNLSVQEQVARIDTLDDEVPGISPYVTPITPKDEFYKVDTAVVPPKVDPAGWRLNITGLVDRPYSLTFDDILAMDLSDHVITLSCVSNPVGGSLVGNAVWTGVPLADLLERAGAQSWASQIVGRSVDDFTAGFPTGAVNDGRNAILAIGMNGELLPINHGFPARLVVAGLYGYVSAVKWLEQIHVTTWDGFDGYWVPRGWSKRGPIKTQSRIDTPKKGRQAQSRRDHDGGRHRLGAHSRHRTGRDKGGPRRLGAVPPRTGPGRRELGAMAPGMDPDPIRHQPDPGASHRRPTASPRAS